MLKNHYPSIHDLQTTSLLPSPTAVTIPPAFTPTALTQTFGVYPIKFSPNGTYADIVDTIQEAGKSKTYSIEASKGQVMSVSVNQSSDSDWVYIPMEIIGEDGTFLCPQIANTECTFWRSVLPATQTYFVKLMPVNAVNFTMRVAVNPPGAATQTFQFNSVRQNAAFTYMDDFALARFPGPQVSKVEPEIALQLIDSQFYVNTNLIEAYLLFGSTNESSIVADCTQPLSFGGTENVVGNVNINGVKFVRSEGGGVGAGNIYEQVYHRAVNNGTCYEVTFYFHYGNIGNYDPSSGIKEFDRNALLQKFESILATLVIK